MSPELFLTDVTKENAAVFFDENALAHETVFNTLLATGVVVQHYPMWTDDAGADWQQVHYQEHLSWSVELGVALPPDLNIVDFDNAQARQSWVYEHALHHQLVAEVLGIN